MIDATNILDFIHAQKKMGKSKQAVRESLVVTIDGFMDMVYSGP